ncbi:MAG: hypothetical protein QM820_14540 [Minicystis sp.]
MRKTIVASTLALAAFTLGSEARAQGWGLHTGDTLRSGDNMLAGEVGWPDLTLGFHHGMSDKVDLGFDFSLIYGAEYTSGTRLGLGMRVPIRISPVKRGNFSFMFHIDPGVKFDSFGGNCGFGNYYCALRFGIWFPLGLEFGIHLNREATLSFGMEMPIFVNLTNGAYGAIPILFGPGFEYHVDDHIAIGLNTKFGPSILAVGDGVGGSTAYTAFGFITQLYFAYRL